MIETRKIDDLRSVYLRPDELIEHVKAADAEPARFGLEGWAGASLVSSALYHAGSAEYADVSFALLSLARDARFPDHSLFDGISGLLFAAGYAMRNEHDYQSLRSKIVDLLTGYVEGATTQTIPASNFAFDVVVGLAGTLIALAESRIPTASVDRIVEYFSWLFSEEDRWLVPGIIGGERREHLHNLSMAHGLAGVLSSVVIAKPQAHALITRLADALVRLSGADGDLEKWRTVIDRDVVEPAVQNASWCYGVPAVAAALYQAGRAGGEERFVRYAQGAMQRLSALQLDFADACFCHGSAGTLALFTLFARATGDLKIASARDRLLKRTLDFCEEHDPLAWSFLRTDGTRGHDVGLLNGTSGTMLAVLFALDRIDGRWMRGVGIDSSRFYEKDGLP